MGPALGAELGGLVYVEWVGAALDEGGGMDACAGMAVMAGWAAVAPGCGGGGIEVEDGRGWDGGMGTAPGWGGGGPSYGVSCEAIVRVAEGWGLEIAGVGPGKAAAAGWAAGYAGPSFVVATLSVVRVGGSAVFGVTPSALVGVIGASV